MYRFIIKGTERSEVDIEYITSLTIQIIHRIIMGNIKVVLGESRHDVVGDLLIKYYLLNTHL